MPIFKHDVDNPASTTQPTSNSDSIDEALHRLSRKPGVKAWLMLDRKSGAVLKTNGHVSSIRPAKNVASSNGANTNPLQIPSTSGSFSAADIVPSESDSEAQAARELASLVWGFITSAGALVDDMDSDVSFGCAFLARDYLAQPDASVS